MNTTTPRIGYACQNLDSMPNTFKTCRIDRISDALLIELIAHNLHVLDAMLDYNIANNNHMMRISSSLIPFASSAKNTFDWAGYFAEDFARLKAKILNHEIRVSCHPGQYTVLNSLDEDVVKRSLAELRYHHTLMELLSGQQNDKMILHVGGIYGDKGAAMDRFIKTYNANASWLRKYLIIENDDRLYTTEDVLNIAMQTGLPVVFDNLHHRINPSLNSKSVPQILDLVADTWSKEDGHPKMHYSQQAVGKRPGAHTFTIDVETFCHDYENDYARHNFDIMLEVKDKNRSFIKVNGYFNPSKKDFEKEWARYKYWVLARSQKHYLAIRDYLKADGVNAVVFYQLIDEAIFNDVNPNQSINAFEHIWGYFKKEATDKEKKHMFKLIGDFRDGKVKEKQVVSYLRKLSLKYQQHYLLDSYYLNPGSFEG